MYLFFRVFPFPDLLICVIIYKQHDFLSKPAGLPFRWASLICDLNGDITPDIFPDMELKPALGRLIPLTCQVEPRPYDRGEICQICQIRDYDLPHFLTPSRL